ncbi:gfo/Idh/MocA family oxidoreductase, partial [Burkholderia multivorans]
MKIGIVGFGLRAGLWRYAHSPADGHEVTIICDISERGRRDAADRIPTAAITDDLGDVLSAGLDAVLVLTPDHAHAPVAIACLEAGIPTFCEKPLATTIEDADAIL